jgi:phage recombination protein Bet
MSEQNTQLDKPKPQPAIIERAANSWGINPDAVEDFLLRTVVKGTRNYKPTRTDCIQFLIVAMEHKLNPFTREIHALVDRDRIVPVVGIDGWMRIANANGFNGSEAKVNLDAEGKAESCTVSVFVKGRDHPVTVTEYMDECFVPPRNGHKGPWQSHPKRMLRHKAFIQACRLAFSVAGVYDEDEAERIVMSPEPAPVSDVNEPDPLLGNGDDEVIEGEVAHA